MNRVAAVLAERRAALKPHLTRQEKTIDSSTAKRCPKCDEVKPLTEFHRDRSRRDGLTVWCRDCIREQHRRYREANPEKEREQHRRYSQENPDKVREARRRWSEENPEKGRRADRRYREGNPEKIREGHRRYREGNPDKVREARRRYSEANPDKVRESGQRNRVRVRAAVFDHYGWSCSCPGCGSVADLTIDHIDGSGRQHRTELGRGGGTEFYRWLIANGFPDGFQTLCLRCNTSKSTGAACRLGHSRETTAGTEANP